MYDLFIYALKASACTGVFFVFYKLLLSRETFHRINRIMLLLGIAASFLLPLLVVTITKEVPLAVASDEIVVTDASAVTNEPLVNDMIIEHFLGIIYIVGIIAMLLRLSVSVLHIFKIVKNGKRTKLKDGSVLVTTDSNIGAFSWLKYIVISKYEDDDARRMIMLHEQGHIRMHHTIDLLLLDVLGSMQWFNPFMWMLRAELKNIHEFEADSYVLSTGADAKEYQLLLIKKAVGASRYSVANSFNHNKLKIRITMMLNEKSSKLARAKALLMLPLLCVGVMAFAETNYVYAVDKGSEKSVEIDKKVPTKVLYVVDGKKMQSVDNLNNDDIAGIIVLTNEDAAVYGDYDKVLEITTKKNDVKDIIVNGIVKDNEGKPVIGAVVKVVNGKNRAVTDRNGKFTLKAKSTDIISASYAGYRTVNMKAAGDMVFEMKHKFPATKGTPTKIKKTSDTSYSSSVSTSGDKVLTITRTEKDNHDGTVATSTSITSKEGSDVIEIYDNDGDKVSVKNNGKSLESPTIIADGKEIMSINDIKSEGIESVTVDKQKNTIFVTLKKKAKPTTSHTPNVVKVIPGDGKKYYVTRDNGTMDIIYAKNENEAIKYCMKHYKESVLLTKRPNGGYIKVIHPDK